MSEFKGAGKIHSATEKTSGPLWRRDCGYDFNGCPFANTKIADAHNIRQAYCNIPLEGDTHIFFNGKTQPVRVTEIATPILCSKHVWGRKP